MANAFTPTTAWRYAGPNGKTLLKVEGTLVIDTTASGGAAADDLPASMFGLKKIFGTASIVVSTEDKIYLGVPDYSNDSLLITDGSASGAVADLPNATYRMSIEGYA